LCDAGEKEMKKTLQDIIEEVVIDCPHLNPQDRVYEAYRRMKLEQEVEALEANW
jgi:hypothetical protein